MFTAGGSVSSVNLGRNLRDISEMKVSDRVVISNQFGSLAGDTESLEIREGCNLIKENKENEVNSNRPNKGLKIAQVIEGNSFAALEKKKDLVNVGAQYKKMDNKKMVDKFGS